MESQINYFRILPQELFIEILKGLLLHELVDMTELDTNFNILIKRIEWDHIIVKLFALSDIRYVIKNFKFKKYDFTYSNINDDDLKLLTHCHTLYLVGCMCITEQASIKLLCSCKEIWLYGSLFGRKINNTIEYLRQNGCKVYI